MRLCGDLLPQDWGMLLTQDGVRTEVGRPDMRAQPVD